MHLDELIQFSIKHFWVTRSNTSTKYWDEREQRQPNQKKATWIIIKKKPPKTTTTKLKGIQCSIQFCKVSLVVSIDRWICLYWTCMCLSYVSSSVVIYSLVWTVFAFFLSRPHSFTFFFVSIYRLSWIYFDFSSFHTAVFIVLPPFSFSSFLFFVFLFIFSNVLFFIASILLALLLLCCPFCTVQPDNKCKTWFYTSSFQRHDEDKVSFHSQLHEFINNQIVLRNTNIGKMSERNEINIKKSLRSGRGMWRKGKNSCFS